MNQPPMIGSPRVNGIREHLSRIQLLCVIANQTFDNIAKYRLMLCAAYSCRAVTKLMLEAAANKEVRSPLDPKVWFTRDELEAELKPRVPFYALIERIRIHDFHRFGICPPNPKMRGVFMGGPVTLAAQKGSAVITLPSSGPEVHTTGSSSVRLQRPLAIQNGEFFDDDSRKYVGLPEVLNAFIRDVPAVVDEFAARTA